MEQTVRQIIERWQRAYSALYSSTVIDAGSHRPQEDHLRLLASANAPILPSLCRPLQIDWQITLRR